MAAGDITYSNPGCMSGDKMFASGIYEVDSGASADVEIICGFQPSMIRFFYKDTGATTQDVVIVWFKGMTAGYHWQTLMSTGAITLGTSNGPAVHADADGEGFTIPTSWYDGSDTIYWMAFK